MKPDTAHASGAGQIDFSLGGTLPLILGLAVLAIPTFITLAGQSWSQEAGAHGPIVLTTGAWLLWRQLPSLRRSAAPGRPLSALAGLIVALVVYVFGRAYDFITLEALGLYGVGLAIFYSKFGARLIARNWFPLLYLGFLIPPPAYLLDSATLPLKQFVSFAATSSLKLFGLPIGSQGVTIFVAQYQLLVEDACSGLNSIIGLLAIGLFYIYLRRSASWTYALFLAALMVPIAIVVNILRVLILILLTYFYGDAAAQGFLHSIASIFMFGASVLLVFGIDSLVHILRPPLKGAT